MDGRTKRSGKGFTGCWTCRERRLKCDEERPSCSRCRRANLECQGYQIRLVWADAPRSSRRDPSKVRYSQRSKLLPDSTEKPSAITRAEVASLQRTLHLDGHRSQPRRSSRALFSVFATDPRTNPTAATAHTEPENPPLLEPGDEAHNCSDQMGHVEGDNLSQSTQAWQSHPNVDFHEQVAVDLGNNQLGTVNTNDSELRYSSSAWVDASPLSPQTTQTTHEDDMLAPNPILSVRVRIENDLGVTSSIPATSTPAEFASTVSSSPDPLDLGRHLDDLSKPSDQSELIRHWCDSLSLSMSPVLTQQARQLHLLLPMALAGLNSNSSQSNGGITIFHSLCAASAFNIMNLKGNEYRMLRLGMRHRQLALFHLRHSMQNGIDVKDESIWAAVWTFLFQEGVRGQPREWRTHLDALRSLICNNQDAVRTNALGRAVYQTYICLAIFGNFQVDSELDRILADIPTDLDCIQPVHGITWTLLQIVLSIHRIANSPKPWSSVECDRVELQLLLYTPAAIPTEDLDQASSEILVVYSHIYYYATVIHFQRLLLRKPPATLQDLVEKAIDNLELTESAESNPKGCVWAWPCLVIATECVRPDLQARMVTWFRAKERHGFLNLNLAGALARDVWDRRASSSHDFHWADGLQGSEYDILPL